MSKVTTPLIMAAVFFVVISPIGLLRRLAGFGSFDKGPAKDMLTYRVPARQPGASDLDRPY